MKLKLLAVGWAIALALGLAGTAAQAADVSTANNVYIMSMGAGMDQYLALRLTTGSVMQVVTDPLRADVVLTDRIGGGFDEKWNLLYPPPKPAPSKDDKGKDKDADKGDLFTLQHGPSQISSGGRGTYFLIDRQTRNIIWSTYARPKSSEAKDVARTADQIAKELAKARAGKKEK